MRRVRLPEVDGSRAHRALIVIDKKAVLAECGCVDGKHELWLHQNAETA